MGVRDRAGSQGPRGRERFEGVRRGSRWGEGGGVSIEDPRPRSLFSPWASPPRDGCRFEGVGGASTDVALKRLDIDGNAQVAELELVLIGLEQARGLGESVGDAESELYVKLPSECQEEEASSAHPAGHASLDG